MAPRRRLTVGSVLGAAHRLDRSLQWGQLLDECQEDRHSLLLLHGDSRQGLGLFLERMEAYLHPEAGGIVHDVYRVPFGYEGHRALSGADWLQRLAHGLARGKPGPVSQHLAGASHGARVCLLLGRRPFFELSPEERQGLQEFLTDAYPACLATAACGSPVRLIVAVESDGDELLTADIEAWAEAAEAHYAALVRGQSVPTRLLHYVPIRELTFPTWEEVKDYLRKLKYRPPKPVVDRLQKEHARIAGDPALTFRNLTEILDRHLEELD